LGRLEVSLEEILNWLMNITLEKLLEVIRKMKDNKKNKSEQELLMELLKNE